MKGNQNAKIKCPCCKEPIHVNNYTKHTKSDKCKATMKKKGLTYN